MNQGCITFAALLPLFAVAVTPGDLDTNFATNGVAKVETGSSMTYTGLKASAAIQADGRIVITRTISNGSNNDIITLRVKQDGTIDTSFGTQGKVTTTFGSGQDISRCVAVQPDGRVIVGGESHVGAWQLALARFMADGTPDSSFGIAGKVTTAASVGASSAKGIVLQSDGKIVTAGSAPGDYNDFAVVRFNVDGSLDSSFGTNGRSAVSIGEGLSNDWPSCIALQSDGKIVVAGYSDGDFAVVRLLANGGVDNSFGGSGKVVVDSGSGGFLESVAIQSDGKILVCGGGGSGDFAIFRFNSDGTLDGSFSSDGEAFITVGDDKSSAYALRVQDNGKILVAGIAQKLISYGLGLELLRDDFALIQMKPDGSVETAFGVDGQVVAPGGELLAGDAASNILMLSDGKILLVGTTSNGVAVARFYGDRPAPALAAPVLTAPGKKTAPGSVLTTLTPSFTWQPVKNATGYVLSLTDASTGRNVYTHPTLGSVTSHVVASDVLVPGFRYGWTMQTRNGSTLGAVSLPNYFTVSEAAPVPKIPAPTSPGISTRPGKEVASTEVAFAWRASAGALFYGLYVTERTTAATVYQIETLPGSMVKHTPPAGTFQAGKVYEWRLRARNARGWSPYSAPFYFSVKPGTALPSPPSLVEPGGTNSPGVVLGAGMLTPTFKWKNASTATAYGLYISDVITGDLIYDEESIPGATLSHTLPGGVLQPGRSYRWNMRAAITGGWTAFSPRRFFQTAANSPPLFISGFDQSVLVGSSSRQLLIIQGSGFRPGARVLLSWTGKSDYLLPAAQTSVESDTCIRILITTTTVPDTWSAKVRNRDQEESNISTFQVLAPSGIAQMPTVTPNGGSFTQPQTVSINSSSVIRYTLDGTEPTHLSPLYSNPILLGTGNSINLKARSFAGGAESPSTTTTAAFKFNLPTFSIPSTGTPFNLLNGTNRYFRVNVPSGLASLNFSISATSGNCDLYLGHDGELAARRASGLDALPTTFSYGFSSRSSGSSENVSIQHPRAGTWYVLVHAVTDCPGIILTVQKSAAKGTALPPAFNPPPPAKGSFSAPLAALKITSGEANAEIYYTLDGSEPSKTSTSTRLYTTPLAIAATSVVKARAFVPDKSPSAITEGTYPIGEAMPAPINFTVKTDTVYERTATYAYAELEISPTWAASEYVDVPFCIEIPEDPLPVMSTDKLSYPVALLVEPVEGSFWVEFFLRRDLPVAGSTYHYSRKTLPDHSGIGWAKRYVLGTRVGKDGDFGDWLRPGRLYYGVMRCWGRFTPTPGFGIIPLKTEKARLRFEIHSAVLDKPAGGITPNLANTWVLSHGKNSNPSRFNNLADALTDPSLNTKVGQVLRLDWSSLARGGDASFDEAMFTPGVGYRTQEVLKGWGISKDRVSLVGHSWGSYVAYQFAKHTSSSEFSKPRVKRLIALDPATTGTGGYWDSKTSFASHAERSWAFVAEGAYGSKGYAITAAESFLFKHDSWGWELAPHSAPIELFTHFIRCNHSSTPYDHNEDEISPWFSIEALDAQPSALWKKDPQWNYTLDDDEKSDGLDGFEAHLYGELYDEYFDPSKGLRMVVRDRLDGTHIGFPQQ
jgi:uncharacterized delta-60 repeat protein